MSQAPSAAPEGYEVVRELGASPFGRALLCRKSGQFVVVRVLGVSGEQAALLEAELRALAVAAEHPCAVTFSRVWTDPALGVCIEQPHCAGGALDSSPGAPMDAALVAAGGVRLAAALAHAHRLGILHGDVCPANVLVDADGNWLLADGGLTAALRHASRNLTVEPDPVFAPRELQGWEAPAEPADVYSLGATLCSQLLGSDDSAGFVPALMNDDSGLGTLFIRMLAPNPADRPSLLEVDEVLRTHVSAETRAALPAGPAGPRPAAAPPRPKVRLAVTEPDAIVRSGRRRTLVAAAAIGAVFLAGATAVAVSNSGDDGSVQAVSAAGTVPESTPSTAADQVSLRPYRLTLQAKESPDGVIVLYVEWLVRAVPAEMGPWRVIGVPRAGDAEEKIQPTRRLVRPDAGVVAPFRYGYFLSPDVPLSWCARVESVVGGSSIPSTRQCMSADAVRKGIAAAKKLAAKQKGTPQPTPKSTPAKKKVRET